MEKIRNGLDRLAKINAAFKLSNDTVERLKKEASQAKVCTPVIGKFSAGKSLLLNTLIGFSILPEDIEPKTAVPTELLIGGQRSEAEVAYTGGETKLVPQREIRSALEQMDASEVQCVRLLLDLKLSKLNDFPTIMLVDMPGFESGFPVHDKAIDNYAGRSLAYLIAFPADALILTESIGAFLRELCVRDRPVCVVITKCDKKTVGYEDSLALLKQNLKRYVGERELPFCETAAKDGDVDQLADYLVKLERQSQELLRKKYTVELLNAMVPTETYLSAQLGGIDLSESELAIKKEQLSRAKEKLEAKMLENQAALEKEALECVEKIRGDVQTALNAKCSGWANIAAQNGNINEQVKQTVRLAVTESVEKNFTPIVKKYLQRADSDLNAFSEDDVNVCFSCAVGELDSGATGKVISGALIGLGAFFLQLPLLGAGLLIGMKIIDGIKGEARKKEACAEAERKLRSEVFPQILEQVESNVRKAIQEKLQEILLAVKSKYQEQIGAKGKALSEVQQSFQLEAEEKDFRQKELRAAQEKLSALRSALEKMRGNQ